MIRLGLRLTLGSGREAALRVLVTAAAVVLGVGLLLMALAGINGLHAQADRGAWLDTSAQTAPSASASSSSDALWWLLSVEQFGNQAIDRVDVAATGPSAPVPPGIAHLPGPGELYASPALTTLLRSVPANELRDRFPGHQIGTIGAAALPSPNSLIIVVGHDARQLSKLPGAVRVRGIQRTLATCYNCQSGAGSGPVLQWILAGGVVALLLPVLILIATASRLSAARREERFAAMRLVGATPRQISVISAVEATVAAVAGMAVGFAFFFLCRPLLLHVPFTGAPLAPGDLSLQWIDVVLVVIGVPIAAIMSARLALRRVKISPLGVSRRASSAPPRIVRIIPLLAGIALLAYFDAAGKPGGIGSQLLELVAGFVLIIVGLVLAGPWLTTAGSRLMANRASRPATLIAGRRLLDNPRGSLPGHQWARARLVRHERSDRCAQLDRCRQQFRGRQRRERHPRGHVLQFLDLRVRPPQWFLPSRARYLRGSSRRQGCAPSPWSTRARPLLSRRTLRGGRVRRAGADARDRQVRTGSDGGEHRLLPFELPWAQLARLLDGLAVRAPVGGGRREASRSRRSS